MHTQRRSSLTSLVRHQSGSGLTNSSNENELLQYAGLRLREFEKFVVDLPISVKMVKILWIFFDLGGSLAPRARNQG